MTKEEFRKRAYSRRYELLMAKNYPDEVAAIYAKFVAMAEAYADALVAEEARKDTPAWSADGPNSVAAR